jgi:hypothetical protein
MVKIIPPVGRPQTGVKCGYVLQGDSQFWSKEDRETREEQTKTSLP